MSDEDSPQQSNDINAATARISARKERVKAAVALKRGGTSSSTLSQNEKKKLNMPIESVGGITEGAISLLMASCVCNLTGLGQKQIDESQARIKEMQQKSIQEVSNIIVVAIQREDERRNDESHRGSVLNGKHSATNVDCEKLALKIQEEWETCLSTAQAIKVPEKLHNMLLEQKALCEEYLNHKKNLIEEYNSELRRKDDDYVKELKRESEEIEQLLALMEKETTQMRNAIKEELLNIEKSFMEERSEQVTANISEIEALFKARRSAESRYLEERSKRIEENSNGLESLRILDAEEFNVLKIKLETDVQILEQQLQQMKATYQLNTEKLEYNYQVLKKRDEENSITVNQQKRRITRMNDIVNSLKTKLAKSEKVFNTEHNNLQEDYVRISSQYNDLQKKFKHFQINDDARFAELWQMNKQEVTSVIQKLLLADKVIHEQHLGLDWKPMEIKENEEVQEPKNVKNEEFREILQKPDDESFEKAPFKMQLLHSKNPIVNAIMAMLAQEAGFLVDEKLAKLLQPLPPHEQQLLKLDTILKALSIETEVELEACLQLFLKEDYHSSASDIASSLGDINQHLEPGMLIDQNEIIGALHQFLGKKHQFVSKNVQKNKKQKVVEPKKEDIKAKWNSITQNLDESRLKSWEGVLKSMEQFHEILVSRKECYLEVETLKQETTQLKQLLKQYMSSDINNHLEIPPTKIIDNRVKSLKNK